MIRGLRLCLSLVCLGAAVVLLWGYPFETWPLAAALLAYACVLWRCPAAFLLVLPIVLPALDLGIWTGRLLLDEADLFVLATLAVLLIRVPPDRRFAMRPSGPGGAAAGPAIAALWLTVAVLAAVWSIAGYTGLTSRFGAPPSDNPLLQPLNAIRVGKSLAEALLLLPFIRSIRPMAWFSRGMAAGLIAVGAIVLVEKLLFSGPFVFDDSYRAVGPFSSMRLGGGHIGAYAAMVLPFAVALLTGQRASGAGPGDAGRPGAGVRGREILPGVAGAVMTGAIASMAGAYVVAASLARTAFAAALTGLLALARGQRRRLVPLLAVFILLAAVGALTGLRDRFTTAATDWLTREGNWRGGLSVRDEGVFSALFGTGLGTYPRAMLARGQGERPTNLTFSEDGAVALDVVTPFYLGQKINPPAGSMHLRLQARAPSAANGLGVLVCDKVLLYSDNCRGRTVPLPAGGDWIQIALDLPSDGLGKGVLGGLITRPVEFSLFGQPGRIEMRAIDLRDDDGRLLLANAGFTRGLDRWVFTDDNHLPWRMKNQYLMLFFETGLLGVLAFLALAACAARTGGAVAASIAAFLVSGLFDDLLEAPRLATLFFLVCFIGLSDLTGRGR